MGPEATLLMFQKIISLSPSNCDKEHIEIFIHNNTNIPDRTDAVLHNGVSALKELSRSVDILTSAGSEIIIIPCMTSHYYIADLQRTTDAKIINAVEKSVLHIIASYPDIKNVGILSTTGTLKSRLFQKELEKYSLGPIILPNDMQEEHVMGAIYGDSGIKAGCKNIHVKNKLIAASEYLIDRGAQVIVAGCTEIPLVLEEDDINMPLIDPLTVLALNAVEECLGTDNIMVQYRNKMPKTLNKQRPLRSVL